MTEEEKLEALAWSSPTVDKCTDKKFLRTLLPENWVEIIYEYDNRYVILLCAEGRWVKSEMMTKLREMVVKEFHENVLATRAEDWKHSDRKYYTYLIVHLKKSNFSFEDLII